MSTESQRAQRRETYARNRGKYIATARNWRAANREKRCAYTRKWTEKNPEKKKAYMQKWSAENRDKKKIYNQAYHAANRERLAEYRKNYHQKNAEKLRQYARDYCKKNREAFTEYGRQWRKSNPEKFSAQKQRWAVRNKQWRKENAVVLRFHKYKRRALVAATLDKEAMNVLSQLVSSAGRLKCGICGKNMPKSDRTIDHIIPLTKGGTGDVWNLRIVHHVCNIRKHATMPDELNFASDGAQPKNNIRGRGEREATSESTFPRAANEQKKEA